MDIALWIAAIVLAGSFLGAGIVKLMRPKAQYVGSQPWAEDFSPRAIKIIGTLEIAAAIGLILPAVTRIATVLVPLAAVGLVLLMIGAAITHARRREFPMIAANATLALIAAFVAVGRFFLVPFGS